MCPRVFVCGGGLVITLIMVQRLCGETFVKFSLMGGGIFFLLSSVLIW